MRRTPRPKSWIICEPSVLPTFIRPIVLTRQLFQPSVNFFDPMSTLTVECGLLISWKSEPENSRSPVCNPFSSHKLHQLGIVANVDDAERLVVADAQSDFARGALQVLDVQRPPPAALKSVVSVSSNTCVAESPVVLR